MLERPPTVVPAKTVPVGTIACPRNCRLGGFAPSLAFALRTPAAATATAAAITAATVHLPTRIAPSNLATPVTAAVGRTLTRRCPPRTRRASLHAKPRRQARPAAARPGVSLAA